MYRLSKCLYNRRYIKKRKIKEHVIGEMWDKYSVHVSWFDDPLPHSNNSTLQLMRYQDSASLLVNISPRYTASLIMKGPGL